MRLIALTTAMKTVAARSAQTENSLIYGARKRTHVATMRTVAAITAIPLLCGVGTVCEERALGWASARRLSRGLQQADKGGAAGA